MKPHFLFGLGMVLILAGCRGTAPATADTGKAVPETKPQAVNERLLHACAAGKLKDVQDALAAGADANAVSPKNRFGSPALTYAVSFPEIVQALLKAGASPTKTDTSGVMPITIAAGSGSVKSVEELLAAGSPAECKGKDGITPLLAAASEGRLDNARILITHGANVNATDSNSHTPLLNTVLSQKGKPEDRMGLIRLLVAHGADVTKKEKSGRTALTYASINLANAMGTNPELLSLLSPKKK
jgi:ankyrin repeat protein